MQYLGEGWNSWQEVMQYSAWGCSAQGDVVPRENAVPWGGAIPLLQCLGASGWVPLPGGRAGDADITMLEAGACWSQANLKTGIRAMIEGPAVGF